MNVLGVTRQNSAVGYHRIMLPLHYMKRGGLISGHVRLTDQLNDEAFKGHHFDIVVMNRYAEGYELDQVLELRNRYGFRLVVDADDYWHLDPWHVLYGHYPTQKVTDHLQAADLVTCTNQLLADAIREELLVQNLHILPNGLPFDDDQFTDIRSDQTDRTRFVYVAGNTHLHDIKAIAGAMKKVQSNSLFRDEASITLCGFQDHEVWHRMAVYLKGGYSGNFGIQRGLPVSQYMNLYNDADVALAPLVDSKFNRMKSNLKALEAAAKRIPLIASDVEPYQGSGYIPTAGNSAEWSIYMREMVDSPNYRRWLGEQLGKECREQFDIRDINKKRAEAYKSLV
jgi:glycosyltransferase involved in cell wall biosynthesis